MGDVAVGQPDAQDPRRQPGVRQRLPDGRAEAAGEHALLDRDQQLVLGRELGREPGIDRLGEARVGDGRGDAALGEDLGRLERLADAGSVAEQRDPVALAQDLAGADLDRRGALGQRDADASPRG